MREADVVVATSGVPGLIKPEMVRTGQVILALTNPVPEIEPDVALAAGAAFAADGTQRQQRARLPGDLPRRAARRRVGDQPRDEARGRVGAGRTDGRGRARPRGARPPRPRHRHRRRAPGRDRLRRRRPEPDHAALLRRVRHNPPSMPAASKRTGREWPLGPYGLWCTVPGTYVTEIVARSGFDWLCVDLQHGFHSIADLLGFVQVADLTDTPVLVRIEYLDSRIVHRVLDAGARGVIFPTIDTAQQAADAVAMCRYPPNGRRSWGPARLALGDPGYSTERADDEVVCIVMVESRAGSREPRRDPRGARDRRDPRRSAAISGSTSASGRSQIRWPGPTPTRCGRSRAAAPAPGSSRWHTP